MKLSKIELKALGASLKESYDLFICSSSYESRCLSIAYNLDPKNIRKALIVKNNDLLEYVVDNVMKLTKWFGERSREVEISTVDPLCTADRIDQSLAIAIENKYAETILLDITTFTHESLLILLRLLKLRCPNARVTGVYANANEYSLGDPVKQKWLSRGIGEVRTVLGYPGNIVPSLKTHLILIVGYEHERAAGMIEALEPNSIALGYGRSGSATTEKDKDANEHYVRLVEQMATSYSDVNSFEIPCDDPHGACYKLQEQIGKAGDRNILIAPMNNKLSTVGTAWAAFKNEKAQLCYAKALSYNYSNYSSPGTNCYIFNLQ